MTSAGLNDDSLVTDTKGDFYSQFSEHKKVLRWVKREVDEREPKFVQRPPRRAGSAYSRGQVEYSESFVCGKAINTSCEFVEVSMRKGELLVRPVKVQPAVYMRLKKLQALGWGYYGLMRLEWDVDIATFS